MAAKRFHAHQFQVPPSVNAPDGCRCAPSGPLRPWLFRIAHNESVTIIRQRNRRPAPLEESMVAGADDAFRRAAAREQLAALLADLQNLTEYQRGALVMRELGGLSYDEIGSALETTPLAARQAVFVARKRLGEGPAGPRRLRPALQLLVGPSPAGFALAGLLGGGMGAKALVATAAAVSIGVGTAELVVSARPKTGDDAARVDPERTPAPGRARPSATPTAGPVVAAATAPVVRRRDPPQVDRAVQPAPTAAVRFAGARFVATPMPAVQAPAGVAPTATPTPAENPQPERHRVPGAGHGRAPEPHPAPTATQTPPPAPSRSRHEPAPRGDRIDLDGPSPSRPPVSEATPEGAWSPPDHDEVGPVG